MTHLIVERCGPGTTLQDAGRFGWQKYGLGPAGAMDTTGMTEANLLVGNTAGVAALEFALAGARLRVAGGRVRVAVAGADADLKIDGRVVAPRRSATAHDGALIEISTARAGLFMYLALAGGFDVPADLGAVATHVRAGVGGIGGRALAAGDHVPCVRAEPAGEDMALDASFKRGTPHGPIRVMLGPQDDYFTEAGRATFLSATYTVTPQADRMGFRLTGPKIEHGPKGYNIVSDGIATGSIQVPGMGEPLVLLADRQTTGGYPKIATVITADLGRLAQMRPGATVTFQAVTRVEALAALVEQRAALQAFRSHLRPATSAADLTSERLLSLNLIDGWTSDGS
jgi:5-oxoprolinase (ATP-hydrolysing) subunit C